MSASVLSAYDYSNTFMAVPGVRRPSVFARVPAFLNIIEKDSQARSILLSRIEPQDSTVCHGATWRISLKECRLARGPLFSALLFPFFLEFLFPSRAVS